jgi:hypothetical protein
MSYAVLTRDRRLLFVVCLCGALSFVGCGGDDGPGKVYTVKGTDADKGNTSKWAASGTIGADGAYSLLTEKKEGAPLGWYKVSVNTNVPPSGDMQAGQPLPQPVAINPMYNDPKQSGIVFEVTESPGANAYDISLVK